MKKILLVIVMSASLLAGSTSRLSAHDEYNTSVYGGYGYGSVLNIFTALLEAIAFAYTSPFTGGKEINTEESFGPAFTGIDFTVNEHMSLGGILAYEQLTRRWQFDDGYTDWNWSFITLMGRMNIEYGWEYFKFYHSLMLGGTRAELELDDSAGYRHSSSDYIFGAHLSLLGIKIGKQFSVFADIGIGYLGLVNFGASYSF